MSDDSIRQLIVFDFDETISTGDSLHSLDILLPRGVIVPHPANSDEVGWLDHHNTVLRELYEGGFSNKELLAVVRHIPAVQGMVEFLRFVFGPKKPQLDVIIMSDANEIFVNEWLVNHGFVECFESIFSNPAFEIPGGGIIIVPYHNNKCCPFSPPNFCKRRILEEYLSKKQQDGICYERIIYIGDGSHDFCPSLIMDKNDIVCARRGLGLDKAIGKYFKEKGQFRPCLIRWDDGRDLMAKLKPKLIPDLSCGKHEVISDPNEKDNASLQRSAMKPSIFMDEYRNKE